MSAHQSLPSERPPAASDGDRARLAEANISPVTGLATDYLNHFNEAIMLLELLATVPDFVADLLSWRPMTYREYFTTSHFKERDLALACYEDADAAARRRLDELVDAVNCIMSATLDALEHGLSPHAMADLGTQAAGWLKPLVAKAGAVINGQHASSFEGEAPAPQAVVDALFTQ